MEKDNFRRLPVKGGTYEQKRNRRNQKTIYKNSAVILRLVLGILSIVISAVVGFQSCAAGIGEAISEAESSSGAGGLFTGLSQLLPERPRAALLHRSSYTHWLLFSPLQT